MAKWRRYSRIGDVGGFGEVYECRELREDEPYGEKYAMKRLTRDDDNSIDRFKREVRMCERLDHPNIVKIVGTKLTGTPPWYVMPLYDYSMESIMGELRGEYERILEIFTHILDGIQYLHNEGGIHRDLKQLNILMNSDEDLVVADFGLGVQPDSDSTRLTGTMQWFGTRFYTAPEQWVDAKKVDHRADIYSLGAMLYRCVLSEEERVHPHSIDINKVPVDFKYIIWKATADSPEDRFSDIREFRDTLEATIMTVLDIEETDDFDSLKQRMSTGSNDDADMRTLARFVDEGLEEEQIEQIVMAMDNHQLQMMIDGYLSEAKILIRDFARFVYSTSFTFSYTDRLGYKCELLFGLLPIDEIELKAIIVEAILELGLSHNRWRVMNTTSYILENIDNAVLANEVARLIKPRKSDLNRLEINKSSLHPRIKALFLDDSKEDEDN